MKSKLYSIGSSDFVKGLITAVFTAVVFSIGSAVNQQGFDVFSANWGEILGSSLNVAISALVGYISKQFITDSKGEILGKADK